MARGHVPLSLRVKHGTMTAAILGAAQVPLRAIQGHPAGPLLPVALRAGGRQSRPRPAGGGKHVASKPPPLLGSRRSPSAPEFAAPQKLRTRRPAAASCMGESERPGRTRSQSRSDSLSLLQCRSQTLEDRWPSSTSSPARTVTKQSCCFRSACRRTSP